MVSIYFFAPNGLAAVQALLDSAHIVQHHYWKPDDKSADVYGILEIAGHTHPSDVIDKLEAAGLHILPALRDTAPVSATLVKHLGKHGVTHGDTSHHVATKMSKVSGMLSLRPHLY